MMCNQNMISRNEKNRSKLAILQSFSVLRYIFRKWEHFQITKFNRVCMALPSSNFFPYKSSYHFWDLNCHQILYFNVTDLKLSSSTYFFLLFPFLVFTKSQVLHLGWVGHVTHCCKRHWCAIAHEKCNCPKCWEVAIHEIQDAFVLITSVITACIFFGSWQVVFWKDKSS